MQELSEACSHHSHIPSSLNNEQDLKLHTVSTRLAHVREPGNNFG